MRVALMALTGDGSGPVRLGGRPVAWHQVQAALSVGCERIVCLADEPGSELAALQREAEAQGTRFHAIANARALSGLVSAADTLFVFAPGLVPDRDWLVQALGARAGVASLGADVGIERGYERIDRERAWAGVLSTRGDAVEALAALPPDADPIAGLLRVALQRGARCIDVPDRWLDDGRWALLADEASARRVEQGWQDRFAPAPSVDRPGEALAHVWAKGLLTRFADKPRAHVAMAAAAGILVLAGGATGYSGGTVAGLALALLGAIVAETAVRFRRLVSAGVANPVGPEGRWPVIKDAFIDAALLAMASSPFEFSGWIAPFAAVMTISAVRLCREDGVPNPVRPLGDRIVVLAILLAAATGGAFVPGMAGFATIALAVRIFWPRKRS